MTAYLIARVATANPELLKDYMTATPPIIARHGGRILARGGKTMTLEGPHESRRLVIIEFPSLGDAENFYHSGEYQEVRKLREGIAIVEFVAIEGSD